MSLENEKTVTETCCQCGNKIEMRWDVDKMGYKAYCPVCGFTLMLCQECQHIVGNLPFTSDCDYDFCKNTCRHNKNPLLPKVEWISAENELPKKRGWYFTFSDETGKVKYLHYKNRVWNTAEWDGDEVKDVTHWADIALPNL